MVMDEGIVNKIRHLLAMAEHPNSNEHEAAIALEKAQQLLLRYNLTRATVDAAGDSQNQREGVGRVDWTEAEGYVWRRTLVYVIARSALCSVVVSPRGKEIHLFGTRDNVQSVLSMYLWVAEQLQEIARVKYLASNLAGGYRQDRRTWSTDFYDGATSAIDERLRKPYQTFADGEGRALININTALVREAVHKVFPRLSSLRGSIHTMGPGYGTGREAGKSVTLARARQLSTVPLLGNGK